MSLVILCNCNLISLTCIWLCNQRFPCTKAMDGRRLFPKPGPRLHQAIWTRCCPNGHGCSPVFEYQQVELLTGTVAHRHVNWFPARLWLQKNTYLILWLCRYVLSKPLPLKLSKTFNNNILFQIQFLIFNANQPWLYQGKSHVITSQSLIHINSRLTIFFVWSWLVFGLLVSFEHHINCPGSPWDEKTLF